MDNCVYAINRTGEIVRNLIFADVETTKKKKKTTTNVFGREKK